MVEPFLICFVIFALVWGIIALIARCISNKEWKEFAIFCRDIVGCIVGSLLFCAFVNWICSLF